MQRMLILGVATALALTACGQSAPDRSGLPAVPEVSDFTPTTNPLLPDSDCVITTSRGVVVNEVTAGYAAAEISSSGS